ncbi:MAG TPA: GspMb/PilO family protein [Pyrinomonadaceae bacterium]|nr:GspMb/PilO family protein [Pyrinomonadaceae bacterium]
MNEQPSSSRPKINKDFLRTRFDKISIFRQGGMFGPAELVALGGSFLILLLVVVGYFYFQMPARSRLERLQLERSRLQTQLRSSNEIVRQGQTTESTVQSIAQSLDSFENNKLVGASAGRMSLYDALNAMIRKNGLRNTSGPTYTPLDPAGTKTATGGTKASTKWQSVYPGVAVSVTVEGPYQNLRRFLRDLETTKQFVIINTVELERSSETNTQSVSPEGSPEGARSSAVSLRLDMATYFQRNSAASADGAQ